jgi:hypothetical protein
LCETDCSKIAYSPLYNPYGTRRDVTGDVHTGVRGQQAQILKKDVVFLLKKNDDDEYYYIIE